MTKTIALIMAGGMGTRFGGDMPKQYLNLEGQSILARTMDVFCQHPGVDHVLAVIHPEAHNLYTQHAPQHTKILSPVNGGDRRQDSVRNGLEALKEIDPDYVLIHDAARPFVTTDIITASIESLTKHSASVPVYAIPDTMKRVEHGFLSDPIDRTNAHAIQTPQNFHFTEILNAHLQNIDKDATDDTSLFQEMGLPVKAIEGHRDNIKITRQSDMNVAIQILKGQKK